ncbi:hypothetical protein LV564_01670 [Komagataeibacter nataicola]|nr:hypothetical protein [Komagataeibacter nataicola]WEQ55851.1 hypothetical protein LV564_01670 [Komagataeibacter nataicola]WNM09287.1 hypothetical protein RI056_04695 [Komagataeibacter nataicola]
MRDRPNVLVIVPVRYRLPSNDVTISTPLPSLREQMMQTGGIK